MDLLMGVASTAIPNQRSLATQSLRGEQVVCHGVRGALGRQKPGRITESLRLE